MSKLKKIEKNIEKNKILLKWEKEFKDQHIKYNLYIQKKERNERKKIKMQKEKEIKMNNEKIKNIEQQKKLENELNKIRIKAIRRNSVYTQKRLGNKSVESSSSNANKKKNTIDFRNSEQKKTNAKRIRTVSYRKNGEDKGSRINWNKQSNDYAFGNI